MQMYEVMKMQTPQPSELTPPPPQQTALSSKSSETFKGSLSSTGATHNIEIC